ncbi:MAG: carbamoyltransferase N-terminal domain-containing protein, partial [Planctomycetota bacterium]
MRERVRVVDGDVHIAGAMDLAFVRTLADRFAKRDVAAAYQLVLEEIAQDLAKHWLAETGLRNICVSGGVHANVKLNQRLREVRGAASVFVYPNMGDGGCATGAAWLAHDPAELKNLTTDNVYHGPDYTEPQIRSAIEKAGLDYETPDDIHD